MGLLQRQVLEEVRQVGRQRTVVEAVMQGQGVARTQHNQCRTHQRQGRIRNPATQEGQELRWETRRTGKRHVGQR